MIPPGILTKWQQNAPWQNQTQVEQDLILSRIIVDLFQNEFLREHLYFRGGTALTKLFLKFPHRYSEDLDFVQREAGPIKPIIYNIQQQLKPWLGRSQVKIGYLGARLYFFFTPESQPDIQRRIKIEINTREHFTVFEPLPRDFAVDTQWFSGQCSITTYQLDDSSASKLKALYQRRKGRDLFDMSLLLERQLVDPKRLLQAFQVYLEHDQQSVSAGQFKENLTAKIHHPTYVQDVLPLLKPGDLFDPEDAGMRVIGFIDKHMV